MPPPRTVDHRIDETPDSTPPSRQPYRLAPPEMEALRQRIQELIEMGHIRPSTSPYGAPVLFVKKKDGTLRLCIDYRALNKQTIRNSAPIPRIDEIFDQLRNAQYFTKLDLDSAYHQVRVAPDHIHKTAFNCQFGHYEFLVMTFGLTNAPATFQSLMTATLRPFLNKFVVVYLDDILIYSQTPEEHAEHIRTVLTTLRQNQLFAKLKKCTFGASEVEYLGHIITNQGIKTDPIKTKAVQEWPVPKDVHELRAFLGLANYYRRFVHHYSHIAVPLTQLLHKEIPWLWTTKHQIAFETLKQHLVKAPILRLFDPNLPTRLQTDSSDFALGATLLQLSQNEWLPIAYESRKLNTHELNYPVYEKELLALIHSLKIWRHYLLGRHFSAFTDQQAIINLLSQPQLNQRQARWTNTLAEFDIKLEYQPGTKNIVADALSRRPDHHISTNTVQHHHNLLVHIVPEYASDPELADILQNISKYPNYSIHNSVLYYKGRICIPAHCKNAKDLVLHEFHDAPTAGHHGVGRTYHTIKESFYWAGMKNHIKEYVQSCDRCQRTKWDQKRPAGLLQPLQIANTAWQSVSMDFLTHLPQTQKGHTAIMVVVDRYSKMAHFIPTKDIATATQTAQLFLDHIFRIHGLPNDFVSDQDSKFTSLFWKTLWTLLGTKLKMATA